MKAGEQRRAYYAANRDKELARTREYYKKNAEHLRAERMRHYAVNPQLQAKWRLANKDKMRFYSCKHSAKRRGIEFALTGEEFFSFWKANCSYCNDPIDTVGIDRADNSKGYTMENSRSCCRPCNVAKQSMSPDEFVAHFRKVVAVADAKILGGKRIIQKP